MLIIRNVILYFSLGLSPSLFALNAGDFAPDFTLKMINTDKNKKQQTISLSNYKGKVVYLDFWASWCGPCRKAFPLIDKLQKQYKNDGFVVLAINEDSDEKSAKLFLLENKVSFTAAFDKGGNAASLYQLRGMPSSFLIDKKGVVKAAYVGFNEHKMKAIKAQVHALVNEP